MEHQNFPKIEYSKNLDDEKNQTTEERGYYYNSIDLYDEKNQKVARVFISDTTRKDLIFNLDELALESPKYPEVAKAKLIYEAVKKLGAAGLKIAEAIIDEMDSLESEPPASLLILSGRESDDEPTELQPSPRPPKNPMDDEPTRIQKSRHT